MTDSEPEWTRLAAAMTDRLIMVGDLDPAWREAFESIPRHVFVPNHPAAEAYSDRALVTQTRTTPVPHGPGVDLPTSSLSAPGAVAVMLARLDAHSGHRVLEIGTGTGYNTALVCHRLGEANVTSVDIDPGLIGRARTALDIAGYHPELIAADGHAGAPGTAPFDRIIATAAITTIPPEWIRQLTLGGRIVAPLFGAHDAALLVLTKTDDDEVTGRIDPTQVSFMPLRANLDNPLAPNRPTWTYTGPMMAHYGRTHLNPATLANVDPDFALFLHLHLPGLYIVTSDTSDHPTVFVSTSNTLAEAELTSTGDGTWTVTQRGTHRPWDTIEHAVRLWDELGHPDRTRFGITATDDPDRQYVWLDDPDGPYSWPLRL